MKFLIGILTGSALILLLATGIERFSGGQTRAPGTSLEPVWAALIESVSTRLFPSRADNPEDNPTERPTVSPSKAEQVIEPAAPLPVMSEPEPPPAHPTPDRQALPMTALTAPNPAAAHEPVAAEPTEPLTVTVWEPFHSQRSAEGFASRLTRELGYPFYVKRRGAGTYDVVVGTDDEIEQARLLARIAEVTGQ